MKKNIGGVHAGNPKFGFSWKIRQSGNAGRVNSNNFSFYTGCSRCCRQHSFIPLALLFFFFFFFNMLMDSTASSCDSLSGSFPWSEHVWSVHRAGCKSLDIHFCLQPPEGLLTSDGSEQVDKELSSAPSPCYYYFSFGIRDLHCSMWDLVPWLGIEPRSPALVVQSCSHWATREAPFIIKKFFFWTMSSGMWDLSSPTRDWTPAPCIGSAES